MSCFYRIITSEASDETVCQSLKLLGAMAIVTRGTFEEMHLDKDGCVFSLIECVSFISPYAVVETRLCSAHYRMLANERIGIAFYLSRSVCLMRMHQMCR